ncbi:MAG: hypothetical protein PHE84_01295 [bacterium]|nr:hypothetical protein [bacterium]
MNKKLALRLLRTTLPSLAEESAAANLSRELQFLADYKYNKYEMYHPGRLFLENLYLWLQQFEEAERAAALNFVRKNLIFVSRQEFEQLAGVLYHDVIKRRQLEITADIGRYPAHKVRTVRESEEFKRVTRSSLYVGMSDGARIDYIRRQNLDICNEQVLPYYDTSDTKVKDLLRELRGSLKDHDAKFRCIFLIDDFCGSGRTLLREVVTSELDGTTPEIPALWRSRLRFNQDSHAFELLYTGEVPPSDQATLRSISADKAYRTALNILFDKAKRQETVLRGALSKVAVGELGKALDANATILFCPLLATEHAMKRLEPLLPKLPGRFSTTHIIPGAVLESSVEITSNATPMGTLCEKYYTDDFGDDHTGCVKFGFDDCGLPVVLHHNTPNNSIYLLWARKRENFNPLFVRYERHGREGA